jgi:two-component system chemotaxis response regulator CheY
MTRSIRALIVDDSNMTRQMIMKDLAATGLAEFSFTEAGDGTEALEAYQPEEMDILFVDMQMPKMDGITFLKELHGRYSHTPPAVMITSESGEDIVRRAIHEAKVDGFLLKPVNKDRLNKGLKTLIDSLACTEGPSAVPHGETVPQALSEMFQQACGLKLESEPEDPEIRQGPVVLGSIGILGTVQWTVVLGFTRESATAIATKFAGMPIEPDGADMGDAISELTNIVAGHIKRLLHGRGIEANISLPHVNAADNIRVLSQRSSTCEHRHFHCEAGRLWSSVTVGLTSGLML